MNRDIRQKLSFVDNALLLGTVLVTFLPWIGYREKSYTIIGFYNAVHRAGGMKAFSQGDVYIYPAFVITVLPAIVAVISAIRFFLQMYRGRVNWMNNTIYLLEGVYMVLLFSFYGWDPTLWNLVASNFVLFDFLIGRFLADYNVLTRKNAALKAEKKKAERERRERLYFPGRYSKQLQRLMLASVDSNRKNRILLTLVGGVTASYTFSLFVLSRSLKVVHSQEMLFLGNGMETIFSNALFVAFLLDGVVMALVISRVLAGRETADVRLIKLGAREDVIRKSWILEVSYCCVISLVLGFTLGLVEAKILLSRVSHRLGTTVSLSVGVISIILVTHNPKLAAQSQVFYHLNDGGVLDAPIRRSEDSEEYYQRIIRQM